MRNDFLWLSEVLYLVMSVPLVVMSLTIVQLFCAKALEAMRTVRKTAHDWLILGVFFSFIAKALDNLYWSLAWGADAFHLPCADQLMAWGVVANIPFRQSFGLIAIYCHIHALQLATDGTAGVRVDRLVHCRLTLSVVGAMAVLSVLALCS